MSSRRPRVKTAPNLAAIARRPRGAKKEAEEPQSIKPDPKTTTPQPVETEPDKMAPRELTAVPGIERIQQCRSSSEKENADEEPKDEEVPAQPRPTTPQPPPSPTKGLPRPFKHKFRPNLSDLSNRGRMRNSSGSESTSHRRIRTISSGSNSDAEDRRLLMSPDRSEPPPIEAFGSPPPATSLLEERLRHPSAGKDRERHPSESESTSGRQRRLTELREAKEVSLFDRRKADHKRKFNKGVPERTRMTMFDLIYYNPSNGSRMSGSSSRRASSAEEAEEVVLNESKAEEEAVDNPEPEEPRVETVEDEEEDVGMPVPQVKVGPDGQIIIDEESMLIETTAAKKAKEDILKTPLVVENQMTNYGTWGKQRRNADWSEKETIRFYKALSIFGTDFSMMESMFKKRSRHDLKLKFKKEERSNRALVDRCLAQNHQFDLSLLGSESEEEEVKPVIKSKAGSRRNSAEKKPKKRKLISRSNRRRSNRGYYSSSDADESEVASESESRRPSQDSVSSDLVIDLGSPLRGGKRRKTVESEESQMKAAAIAITASSSPATATSSTTTDPLAPSSGSIQFPPGLLEANPGLANAAPGSLVVVASPSLNTDPNQHLLHVYMVGPENKQQPSPRSEDHGFDPNPIPTHGSMRSPHPVRRPSSGGQVEPAGSGSLPSGRVRTISGSSTGSAGFMVVNSSKGT